MKYGGIYFNAVVMAIGVLALIAASPFGFYKSPGFHDCRNGALCPSALLVPRSSLLPSFGLWAYSIVDSRHYPHALSHFGLYFCPACFRRHYLSGTHRIGVCCKRYLDHEPAT